MILGIDPGLENTGWGIIKYVDSNDRYELVDFGVIKTNVASNSCDRLGKIFTDFTKLLLSHDIEVVAMESLYFAKNAKSALKVAEAIGVIKSATSIGKLELYEYTPIQVKLALTGYGRAEKDQVETMVRQSLNLEKLIKPDHAADAVAVALTHCFSLKIDKML